jgi:uncharacterized protein (DUF58 family)
MNKAASRRVIWILLGLSLFALATTGSEIYSRLSYLWALLLAGSWLWSRTSISGIEVRRQPRLRRAHLGQIFEERYEIYNPGRLPRLWIEIRDESKLPGSRGSHVVTMVGQRQRRSYLARSRLMQRGIFELGPTTIASSDPFGFFPAEWSLPVSDHLLVFPLMVDVTSFPNPPGVLMGGEALRRRTHHVTPNAAGVRDYASGDSLNRIHWPTTVRRDKLTVKEFELDPQADIWLFVDAQRSVHAARPFTPIDLSQSMLLHQRTEDINLPPATEEYAASIAASLARYYLRIRRAVGVVVNNQGSDLLPPDRGGRQLGKVLEIMALFRSDGTMPFPALIEAQAQHITRGSTIVLITPSVDPVLIPTLDYISRRGLRPVVVLIHAQSFGGAPGTEELGQQIKAMKIPIRCVDNGADIPVALVKNL